MANRGRPKKQWTPEQRAAHGAKIRRAHEHRHGSPYSGLKVGNSRLDELRRSAHQFLDYLINFDVYGHEFGPGFNPEIERQSVLDQSTCLAIIKDSCRRMKRILDGLPEFPEEPKQPIPFEKTATFPLENAAHLWGEFYG